MSYKVVSFPVGASLGLGTFVNTILTGIANSLVSCSSTWSIVDDVSKVNNIDGYRTVQVYNSETEEYIRFWCINSSSGTAYSASIVSQSTSTTALSNSGLFVHKNNLLGYLDTSFIQKYHGVSFLFFGVSNNSIDEDPGNDLSLKFPLTCLGSYAESSTSISAFSPTASNGGYNIETAFYIVSNGLDFYIIRRKSSVASASSLLAYSSDGINLLPGDSYSRIALALGSSKSGSDIPSDRYYTFQDAYGSYNLCGNSTAAVSTSSGIVTQSSTKLVAFPALLYANITYAGSSGNGINDGICFKGYTKFNFVRFCSSSVLTSGTIGATYMGGSWLHIGHSTLIPWESGVPTPFE